MTRGRRLLFLRDQYCFGQSIIIPILCSNEAKKDNHHSHIIGPHTAARSRKTPGNRNMSTTDLCVCMCSLDRLYVSRDADDHAIDTILAWTAIHMPQEPTISVVSFCLSLSLFGGGGGWKERTGPARGRRGRLSRASRRRRSCLFAAAGRGGILGHHEFDGGFAGTCHQGLHERLL